MKKNVSLKSKFIEAWTPKGFADEELYTLIAFLISDGELSAQAIDCMRILENYGSLSHCGVDEMYSVSNYILKSLLNDPILSHALDKNDFNHFVNYLGKLVPIPEDIYNYIGNAWKESNLFYLNLNQKTVMVRKYKNIVISLKCKEIRNERQLFCYYFDDGIRNLISERCDDFYIKKGGILVYSKGYHEAIAGYYNLNDRMSIESNQPYPNIAIHGGKIYYSRRSANSIFVWDKKENVIHSMKNQNYIYKSYSDLLTEDFSISMVPEAGYSIKEYITFNGKGESVDEPKKYIKEIVYQNIVFSLYRKWEAFFEEPFLLLDDITLTVEILDLMKTPSIISMQAINSRVHELRLIGKCNEENAVVLENLFSILKLRQFNEEEDISEILFIIMKQSISAINSKQVDQTTEKETCIVKKAYLEELLEKSSGLSREQFENMLRVSTK